MKHLIVCLDGTWSNADSPEHLTNIGMLANIIAPRSAAIDPNTVEGIEQRIYYDAGVGTGGGFVDRIVGGAFGRGLSANILAAYRFLSQFYRPGDHIYVFGFSRGAFTARSLCGFLSASGLLTADACNTANEEFAWNYYRTPPKSRYPADKARLERLAHVNLRIRFLGVFDTVGSLGIPHRLFNWVGRRAIQFHDADLSSVVDHSCHALAIDEHRKEFEASLWTEPRHSKYRTAEQAWFPGGHANVGGGCEDRGLSDMALDWMLKRLGTHCPELTLRPVNRWVQDTKPDFMGRLHQDRSWLFWRSRWRPLIRLINRCAFAPGVRCRLPSIRPHSLPIGEMVHWSALARWEQTKGARRRERYQPRNLLAALEKMQQDGDAMLVAGIDGEPTRLPDLFAGVAEKPKAASRAATAATRTATAKNGAGHAHGRAPHAGA
jgi:Uncharacterized alpha/beta hydrolase domain (DUF2235)